LVRPGAAEGVGWRPPLKLVCRPTELWPPRPPPERLNVRKGTDRRRTGGAWAPWRGMGHYPWAIVASLPALSPC